MMCSTFFQSFLALVAATMTLLCLASPSSGERLFLNGSMYSATGELIPRQYPFPEGTGIENQEVVYLDRTLSADGKVVTTWANSLGLEIGYHRDARTGEYLGTTQSFVYLYGGSVGQPIYTGWGGPDDAIALPPHRRMMERVHAPPGGADYLARGVTEAPEDYGPAVDVLFDSQTGLVRQAFGSVLCFGPGPLGLQSRLYANEGQQIVVYEEVDDGGVIDFQRVNSYASPINVSDAYYYDFVIPIHAGADGNLYFLKDNAVHRMNGLTGEDLGVFVSLDQYDSTGPPAEEAFTSIRMAEEPYLYVQYAGVEKPYTAFTKFDLATGQRIGGFEIEALNIDFTATLQWQSWEIVEGVPEPSSVAVLASGVCCLLGRRRRVG
ncbi:hypothetical protein Pla123a_05190 [Posidoniimonas polymericola]|uniref:PEP-CTERM protein-sorting domain-containing protein n=1 Tax=Posidoniimonas polymericola TaxID=2528002 RepID=A0A5C5ZEG5_9BACT|nr:PEP-CTERM sorting domain-containing protein [Posidoniimonas polymericola]TWT85712.1 hypothetical protein Pla123a_05190 [Posidoniimonas polymericola]